MNYIYTEHDYLAHYGVKGMKWGVRKAIDRTMESGARLGKEIGKNGVFRGGYQWHAQNVYNRLNNFSNSRKKNMSWRQKQSYESAKDYWKQKSSGKTNAQIKESGRNYRGFIRRNYDSWRSRSLATRSSVFAGKAAIDAIRSNSTLSKMGLEKGSVVGAAAASAALSDAGDWLVSKIFGHF